MLEEIGKRWTVLVLSLNLSVKVYGIDRNVWPSEECGGSGVKQNNSQT